MFSVSTVHIKRNKSFLRVVSLFGWRGSNEEEKHFNQSKFLVSSLLANLSLSKTVISMDPANVQA